MTIAIVDFYENNFPEDNNIYIYGQRIAMEVANEKLH